jgi:hypothetical protein
MSLRETAKIATASIVSVCVALYLAAVSLFGDVEGRADWWPYSWLWFVAATAVLASIVWFTLRHWHPTSSITMEATPVLPERLSLPSPSPIPAQDQGADPTVVEVGDMRATRAANGTWGVKWMTSGKPVGTVTPLGQGFLSARHIQMGDAGQHSSIQGALHAIWELD